MIRPDEGDHLVMVIRPEPRGKDAYGRDPEYRLRGVLKRLLRSYGWRCVSLRPIADTREVRQRVPQAGENAPNL